MHTMLGSSRGFVSTIEEEEEIISSVHYPDLLISRSH